MNAALVSTIHFKVENAVIVIIPGASSSPLAAGTSDNTSRFWPGLECTSPCPVKLRVLLVRAYDEVVAPLATPALAHGGAPLRRDARLRPLRGRRHLRTLRGGVDLLQYDVAIGLVERQLVLREEDHLVAAPRRAPGPLAAARASPSTAPTSPLAACTSAALATPRCRRR